MLRMQRRLMAFKLVWIFGFLAFLSPLFPATGPALAQTDVSVSAEFRSTLEPYGEWRRHARWGEVWTPANVDRGWRPYTEGRWVYTNDYGWYWVEDESEAAWGLLAYHYGRWVWDVDVGWCWVPGRQWAPAWVDWRRGSRAVGWAPLPPDEVIAEVRDEPIYWTFVLPGDLLAPRVVAVALPQPQVAIFIRETVVVNRTVIINDRGPSFAVNPGIPASYIAAAYRRPIRVYEIRPRVLAGTVALPGAVGVRAEDIRTRRDIIRSETFVRESREVVRPARNIPPPRPLAATERGRLGDLPPRAARGRSGEQGRQEAPDATTGARPRDAREPDRGARETGRDAGRNVRPPARGESETSGRTPALAPERSSREGAPKAGREGREGAQERRGGVGRTESDSPARDRSGRSGAEMPRGDSLRERARPPAAAEGPRRGGSAAGAESPRRGGSAGAPSAGQRSAPSVSGPRGGPGPETTGAAPRGGGPGLRDGGGGPGLRGGPGGASGGPRGGPGGPGGGPGGPR